MTSDSPFDLTPDMCFDRGPNLSEKHVADEILVLDESNEEIHQLNATASLIWNSCDGKTTLGEVIELVTQRFVVEEETAARDVKQTIKHFLNHQLICTVQRKR